MVCLFIEIYIFISLSLSLYILPYLTLPHSVLHKLPPSRVWIKAFQRNSFHQRKANFLLCSRSLYQIQKKEEIKNEHHLRLCFVTVDCSKAFRFPRSQTLSRQAMPPIVTMLRRTCFRERHVVSSLLLRQSKQFLQRNQQAHQKQLFSTTTTTSRVRPSVRQQRPHVNGQAVAFHVRDLIPQQQPQHHYQLEQPITAITEPISRPQDYHLVGNNYESDLVVVLDMDECMIHSLFLSNPMTAQVMAHQIQSRRRNNKKNDSSGLVEHFQIHLPDSGDLVHVNVRPGLREFVDDITSRYETHIFTAAMPVYANSVLDTLDPDNSKFAARWYRQHCAWDEHRNAYVKDLSALPLSNLARTVLVDNNPLSFLSHPSNGILVSSFFDDPDDDTLKEVQNLLRELERHDDVRPVLREKFKLKKVLVEIGNKIRARAAKRS